MTAVQSEVFPQLAIPCSSNDEYKVLLPNRGSPYVEPAAFPYLEVSQFDDWRNGDCKEFEGASSGCPSTLVFRHPFLWRL
jgi:hypothetical protein